MSAPPPDLKRLEDKEAVLSKEEIIRLRAIYNAWLEERKLDSRLSLPTPIRLTFAAGSSFLMGLGLGTTHGSTSAGYRFRAENAHRLPSTPTGWYLYHKSKNYHMAFGGIKEGIKMGSKMAVWTGAFFWIEDQWDDIRGKKDVVNTVLASATVAGAFSLWNRFPLITAARTAKTGLAIGLAFGLAQDLLSTVKGRPPCYLKFMSKTGKPRRKEAEVMSK